MNSHQDLNNVQKHTLDELRKYLSEAALQPELDAEVARMIELYQIATKRAGR